MSDPKHLVVVSDGGANKLFCGYVHDLDALAKCVEEGELVILQSARHVKEVAIPTPQGIAVSIHISPYSICRTGIDLHIKITHYFVPQGIDQQKLEELIEACKRDELKHRIEEAGLSTDQNVGAAAAAAATADGLRTGPGGRMR